MTQSGEYILAWLDVLDELTYFELFDVGESDGADAIRAAFHAFCDTFHPDRHVARDPDERDALSTIFKRGTEAFLILSDASLKEQYVRDLAQSQHAKPPRMSAPSRSTGPSQAPGTPTKLKDSARSPSSRPFAEQADSLIARGELRKAKLQLVMANHLDPQNETLLAALRDVETKLRGL